MNQPPPLSVKCEHHYPRTRTHDLVGAAALAFGIICAISTWTTMIHWREIGEYRASLPASATEGAMGFSLQFTPWLMTFFSLGLGIIVVALLAVSCLDIRSRRQPQFTFLHIATGISLFPLLFLLARFAMVFLDE